MTLLGLKYRHSITLWLCSLLACQSQPEVSVLRGEELYGIWCSGCHGSEGQGNPSNKAPSIAGLPQWYLENQLTGFQSGFRGIHEEDISGQTMQRMSIMALAEKGDLPSVAGYVSSMPVTWPNPTMDGNPELGKQPYQVCAACHGLDGLGDEKISAPPIVQLDDWYLIQELENFKIGARGVHPEDAWGPVMRQIAVALGDVSMENVVAYIQTLRKESTTNEDI
jgi:cytochrome c553